MQPQRKPAGRPPEITIAGDEATVAMAAAPGEDLPPAPSAAPLLPTREQAAQRGGCGLDRFIELVRVGTPTNHGSQRTLLVSPETIEEYSRALR